LLPLSPLRKSLAVGVGNNENPFPFMGRTNGARRKSNPFRIKPHAGKITEDAIPSQGKQPWRIFHEHVAGSKYANHSREMRPEPARITGSLTPTGKRYWLTGSTGTRLQSSLA
jgi:hypothetical protein